MTSQQGGRGGKCRLRDSIKNDHLEGGEKKNNKRKQRQALVDGTKQSREKGMGLSCT